MTTPLMITEENRDEWLAKRRNSIGASDAAAVLGVDPWRAPIDVWQEKLGLAKPIEDSEAMLWGRLLEPVLAEEYQRRTGAKLVGQQLFYQDDERPWMTATLDGLRDDGRIVEFKTASAWAREWGDEDTDHVPESYLCQVHHQMSVCKASSADLAVLIGGQNFKIYTIQRDEDLIHLVHEHEDEFWLRVKTRQPPDWGKMDSRTLAILHPECTGEIELGEGIGHAIHAYIFVGEDIKQRLAAREEMKTRILGALGSAQLGRLPDGRLVKRFIEEVEERQQTVKAHTRHYFKILKGEAK